MADPRLHGNGTTCATCAGRGRVWIPHNPAGRRFARCPARCTAGRIAIPPAEIIAREIAPNAARGRPVER